MPSPRIATRAELAVLWLGLLGMASMASAGAWADYVPLTCVWLLAAMASLVKGDRVWEIGWVACAVLQVTLIGTLPLGDVSTAGWMLPISLVSAVAMLVAFGSALVVGSRSGLYKPR